MYNFHDRIKWCLYRSKRMLRIISAYVQDTRRYARGSATLEIKLTPCQLEALMVTQYHTIEKALSLSEPRPTFGRDHVVSLLKWMKQYRDAGYDVDNDCYQQALFSLTAYLAYHAEQSEYLGGLEAEIEMVLSDKRDATVPSPVVSCTHPMISETDTAAFARVVLSRHSVRVFENTPPPDALVLKALELAKESPSACNRQPWRVLRIKEPDRMRRLCELQNGNKGFGHLAGEFMILSSDIGVFHGAHERHQAYIDGGIFSMSLMLALHSVGLGCCPLNWSAKPDSDQKLRRAFNIPDHEVVVMCLAVGVLPGSLQVARSHKRPVTVFTREDKV